MAGKQPLSGQMKTLQRVFSRVGRQKWLLLLSVLASAVNVALVLYIPMLVGDAIDGIVSAHSVDFSRLSEILLKILFCILVSALASWLVSIINNRVTYRMIREIREQAFAHIHTLPLSYLDSHPAGGLVSRVISDTDTFADGLLMGFTQFFSGIVTILGTLIFMLRIHAGITLIVLLITPLSLFAASFIARRTHDMFRAQSEARATETAMIDEMIVGLPVIQAFSREKASSEAFDSANEHLRSCSLRAIFFSSITNPSTRFVNNIVYAGVALSGALAVIGGGLTVGGLSCLLSYANQYTKPFNEISGVIAELQNALACAERIFDLIEEKPETPDSENAVSLSGVSGEISIQNVSFSYAPEKPLIEHFDLHVSPGQRIAIVGPTGCGKTTFINLLMRFYDVRDGSISVDGEDIRDVTRLSLRRSYGMVLQDTWLRTGTIRDNIRQGRPDASEEEVTEAAKAAHAHSFIKRLPQGYDTVIGEEGEGLSQGQKQLLCIARVMLCLPPMLILDEATSSIDTRTEIQVQNAFSAMMRGRTSFIVAHRLSTIMEADKILVMRDGHIVESGKHEELLKKGGFYAQLYESQFAI